MYFLFTSITRFLLGLVIFIFNFLLFIFYEKQFELIISTLQPIRNNLIRWIYNYYGSNV